MAAPRRIDTHHHIVPAAYAAWLKRKGMAAGGLPIPEWSADAAIALMDKYGIQTAILSVSTPGVNLGDDAEARAKAREVNEHAAELARKHPSRFGFFATLCLPDVRGSLDEVAYAFDKLRADGVILLANSRGIYLGDSRFDPLFDELNRRKVVVFVHPSILYGNEPPEGLPPFIADFLLDTTRAAIRLAGSGTLDRCPDLKVILSHAGGFVPYAAHRIAGRRIAEAGFCGGARAVAEVLLRYRPFRQSYRAAKSARVRAARSHTLRKRLALCSRPHRRRVHRDV